ncbi:putative bifunctional diguanylate cyclase/phosphodiesterase [Miltoncostaea oceani]|uniref:putative bifunctional diguanylate cyclase/phosphodiesterase n=1 Tax=Miltoncostaea oceani TaxID=2843216 RepID=UPI001C3C9715|nr:EAL domain-containing protein [Miltoncostaea oceani]
MENVAPRARVALRTIRSLLPQGRLLPEDVWNRRHRGIVRLALAQAAVLAALAAAVTGDPLHALLDGAVVALPAVPALMTRFGRQARAMAAAASLFLASAVLVHLAGGLTEMHFHFFVMVCVVSLYQDWAPFGMAVGITLVHHLAMGIRAPREVYGSEAAARHPVLWAAMHTGFLLAAALANMAAWRLSEQQGLRDPLTRLPNRTLLAERLLRRVDHEGQPTSVLFVDLDDFKTINDSRGHWVGDEVLTAVAGRLRGAVRDGDTVARLGGDEFAVLVAGPPAAGQAVAARVVAALDLPIELHGAPLWVRGSVGLAHAGADPGRTADDLLREADLAMYEAKAGGKNRVAVFSARLDATVRRRAELSADLAGAIDDGQLEVHYQPTVRMADGRPIAVEALLRWRHPRRGLVPPGDFIPLAEETRQIGRIGAWVLGTALRQLAEWRAHDPALADLTMAINLSPAQLDDGLVEQVAAALADAGVDAAHLTLEVTESVFAADLVAVAEHLSRLRDMGVRIAIDDFGTGYSSLSYLRHLPVDVLKVDQSFVADLGDAGVDALVRSILDLARALDLEVVAEGVETPDQAALLRGLRCGAAQGFLYARPVPADEARVLLGCARLPRPAAPVPAAAPASPAPVVPAPAPG